MNVIAPGTSDYYETFLRVAATENLKIEVKPDEMREFLEAAKAMADPERVRRRSLPSGWNASLARTRSCCAT